MPVENLTMGVPFFGQTHTRDPAGSFLIGSPSLGPGVPGEYLNTSGIVSYGEVGQMKYKESVFF